MKFGILFKLVVLLLLVGALPLLAALGIVVIGGGNLRTATLGQGLQTHAEFEAGRFEIILDKDVAKYFLAVNEDSVIKDLLAHTQQLASEQIRSLDARWPSLSVDSPEVADTLHNAIASHLRQILRVDPRCREIILTDRFGQLVAASNKSSDFYQADEEWWQRAYNGGEGMVFVPPISFDESSGVWGIEIAVPIYSAEGPLRVVGVAKATLDLSDWLAEVVAGHKEENTQMSVVNKDGAILYTDANQRFLTQLSNWEAVQSHLQQRRWHVLGGDLEAICPVNISSSLGLVRVETPQWYVIIRAPIYSAMSGIYRLSLYVLIIGLILVAATFGLGVYAANRNIVRPLSQLRAAAERVAAGDLTHRVPAAGNRLGGNDEISQLTEDFNRMVVAVAASHAALTEANELKSRFMRVAGHELRTPISYIVSMTALLSKTAPNDSVRAAAEKIAARGHRLDQIITQMFQLLGEGQFESTMLYSRFDVQQLVQEVIAELRPFLENRQQKTEVLAEGSIPEIEADRGKLHDVLMSLINNAIKFTPDAGTIHVTLSSQVGHRLAIRVRDEGSGVSPELLPHIFEPFWGAPDLMKHSSGEYGFQKRGPGLGLAIARHFIRLHGGQILVTNTPTGAEFAVLIPVAPPGAAPT